MKDSQGSLLIYVFFKDTTGTCPNRVFEKKPILIFIYIYIYICKGWQEVFIYTCVIEYNSHLSLYQFLFICLNIPYLFPNIIRLLKE